MKLEIYLNQDARKTKVLLDGKNISANVRSLQVECDATKAKPFVNLDLVYDSIEITGDVDVEKTTVTN